ncbi:MAG: cation transporter [Leptolyngbya sp. SIO1D8]|nr:cation transporter [Leptolyngbya sp. SIO1D8]
MVLNVQSSPLNQHPHNQDADYRNAVRRVLTITLLLNIFVVVLKSTVGFWTGSLSILADALHSVTDSANNILGLVTNQLASPQPDRKHPYGHQKYEAVGALGIAAFLGIACFEILQNVVDRIVFGGEPVTMTAIALWMMLVVLCVNIGVAFYERWAGLRLGSKILIADAHHTMSDVWITISVLGGLMGVWLGWFWLDIAMAFPVSILVFKSGWDVLRENLPWLVDEMAIAPEAIQSTVIQVPGVINCHEIASRGLLGRQVFIDMHLIVQPRDVEKAHEITEHVEAVLEEKYGPARITIHIEPLGYQSTKISY